MSYHRKHMRREEAAARQWFTRSEWTTRGVTIPKDAAPKGTIYNHMWRKAYPLFSADQGVDRNWSRKERG